MNLSHLLEQVVSERGSEIAIRFSGTDITYATLSDAVRRLSRGLQKLGVKQGDRVAVMLPNLPQFPIAYYAILRLGAVVVPVNMMYKGREIASLLEDSEARILIAWRGVWDEIARFSGVINSLKQIVLLGENLPESTLSLSQLIAHNRPMAEITAQEEDDAAVIQYTSGVTGNPKGAELTHGNLISNLKACREVMRVTERDIILSVLPLFHPMGQTLLMNLALCSGSAMDLLPRFEPEELFRTIMAGKSSIFAAVPSIFRLLLDCVKEGETLPDSPVRLCICGGGAISEEVLKSFEKTFNTYILECYTTSETSPVNSFNQWKTGRRVGSLGHPIPGVEMKVVDDQGNEASIGEVGEIVIKGNNVMRGYINKPRLSGEVLRDGWFYSGDLGKMDINGFFYLVDRKNDRIIKGGFSIYPSEVETILYGHPDILEVAVIGVPDEIMGEEVKACIVLKEDAKVTTEQLFDYCRARMALYKVPALIRFYKDLPHTATGKINKSELRG